MPPAAPAPLRLPERLTHGEVGAWLETCRSHWPAGEGVVQLDAAALRHFDSSALAALLELRRWALSRQQVLRLDGAPPRLAELAALYGVDALLGT